MVKGLCLGLLAAIVCLCAAGLSVAAAAPLQDGVLLADDGSVRSERSTNLSHITGSLRKIQMYVKNWHLQILPDGIVNGTSEDTTDFTILQRTTVNIGQVKIQGVSTCQYLCMDSCGLLYGTKEFNDECVFNEMIEQHNYNTYSSARYSNARRTMYLALNRRGQPRKVQVRAQQQLGKLSTYARVLTKWVSVERVEELLARLGHHPLRHHGQQHICAATSAATPPPDPASGDRLRCRKRKKRKKKRRRCPDNPDLPCGNGKNKLKPAVLAKRRKLCEQDSSRKICQRLVKSDNRQNKKKNNKKQLNAKKKGNNKDKKTMRNNNKKSVKKVLAVLNATTSAASEESTTWWNYGDDEYSSTTETSLEDSANVSATEDSEQASEQTDDDLVEPTDAASTSSAPGVETETD